MATAVRLLGYHSLALRKAPQTIESFPARLGPDAKTREREKREGLSCQPSLNAELLPRPATAR
jgi:hypothetical protein